MCRLPHFAMFPNARCAVRAMFGDVHPLADRGTPEAVMRP